MSAQRGPLDYSVRTVGFPFLALRRDELLEFDVGSSPGVYWRVASPIHAGLSRHPLASSDELEDVLNSWFVATPTLLPMIPLWPGFAANTLLYAGAAYGILRLPRRLRARARLRRNKCPKCVYPIGSHPICPECGTPLPGTRPASER